MEWLPFEKDLLETKVVEELNLSLNEGEWWADGEPSLAQS